MFADRATIIIRSGKGGDGHVSFIRLKYIYAPARAVTVTLASDVSFSFLQEDQTAATAVRAET